MCQIGTDRLGRVAPCIDRTIAIFRAFRVTIRGWHAAFFYRLNASIEATILDISRITTVDSPARRVTNFIAIIAASITAACPAKTRGWIFHTLAYARAAQPFAKSDTRLLAVAARQITNLTNLIARAVAANTINARFGIFQRRLINDQAIDALNRNFGGAA